MTGSAATVIGGGGIAKAIPLARRPNPLLAWTVVVLLSLLYCLSFIDRMILTLLVGPIKADLGFSDTQLGMLHGVAFGLFYATVGYPLGLWADHRSRKWLIVVGVLLWVGSTALSAFVRSFSALFLCRMGLGLGEAALSPAALSMIADYFPPNRRARAVGLFITGASVGGALAVIVGGELTVAIAHAPARFSPIGGMHAWQAVLLVVSIPGFVLAVLMMFVPEPSRDAARPVSRGTGLFAYLRHRRVLLSLHIGGMTLCSCCSFGMTMWIPSLLIRELGWSAGDVARLYGPLLMAASVLGMVGSGVIADRGVRLGDPARTMKIAFASVILLLLSGIWIALIAHGTVAMMAGLALFSIAGAAPFGVSLTALISTTHNRFRGQITALYLLGINFGGFMIGPPLAGFFSDRLFPGPGGLGRALALLAGITLPGAALMLRAAIAPYRAALAEMGEGRVHSST
jgi:MFS family permease